MPTLNVSPNPAPPSTLVSVAGSGFANAKTRLLLDGAGATTNVFRPRKDGTFNVGITVSSTAKTQTLVAQQLSSTWTDKASVSIVVQAVVTPPPPPPTTTLVSSVAGLLSALADNAITDITVALGTYHVSTAASQASDSLWIGSRFAGRTNPVTVHAATPGGVTFDGGGAAYFGGITFVAGAHDQTWDGFKWANGAPGGATDGTGVVVFGGYAGEAAPHHITIKNSTVKPSAGVAVHGHCVYFSWAVGGPHDIVFDNVTFDATSATVIAALHFYHSDSSNLNAWNVDVRNSRIMGTQQAVMLWDRTIHDIVIEDSTITGASEYAIRYELGGGPITIRNVTSTGSGVKGFYSGLGTSPPGITFVNCTLN